MTDYGTFDGPMPAYFDTDEPTVFRLRFGYTRPPISANDTLHWRTRAKLVKDIRQATSYLARRIPHLGRCEVTLTWFVTDRRRRDADNVVPTLKAMCDELVAQGVVHDDTPQFMVKHMPIIEYIDKDTDSAHMVLTVAPISPEAVAA